VHRDRLAVFGDDLFGLDVEDLADFVESAFAEFAVSRDVSGHLELLAVERLKARVESVGWTSELDVKRACQEECSEGQAHS
jgi:hypothetical protein